MLQSMYANAESNSTTKANTTNPHPELQYLDLVRQIIGTGDLRKDRTGTGTLSLFAPPQLRFSLADNTLPLLTTKRTFLRPVFEELMWFIRGQTDSKILAGKGVHIWDANGSREALDRAGLGHRQEGDLGPIYGFQWRHFGASYENADTDYTGKGIDQLEKVIEQLVSNPTDRRIILSAWNPLAIPDMALPPCHILAQLYVSTPSETHPVPRLSCQLYQRSCDMGLGVPFNIASYSLLTIMLAHVCGFEPGEFIHCLGDAHVYCNHIDALQTQLERTPRPFPKIFIKRNDTGTQLSDTVESTAQKVARLVREMETFEYEHIDVVGYTPHNKIAMDMSV
ncbi:Thymidylate synthase [Batrachochytrium dendrobatidis]